MNVEKLYQLALSDKEVAAFFEKFIEGSKKYFRDKNRIRPNLYLFADAYLDIEKRITQLQKQLSEKGLIATAYSEEGVPRGRIPHIHYDEKKKEYVYWFSWNDDTIEASNGVDYPNTHKVSFSTYFNGHKLGLNEIEEIIKSSDDDINSKISSLRSEIAIEQDKANKKIFGKRKILDNIKSKEKELDQLLEEKDFISKVIQNKEILIEYFEQVEAIKDLSMDMYYNKENIDKVTETGKAVADGAKFVPSSKDVPMIIDYLLKNQIISSEELKKVNEILSQTNNKDFAMNPALNMDSLKVVSVYADLAAQDKQDKQEDISKNNENNEIEEKNVGRSR